VGPPDGMPVVFWHALGPGHSGASFAVAAEPLARAGYRALAIDAPRFGRLAARARRGLRARRARGSCGP
jgi:hypothetical protein